MYPWRMEGRQLFCWVGRGGRCLFIYISVCVCLIGISVVRWKLYLALSFVFAFNLL